VEHDVEPHRAALRGAATVGSAAAEGVGGGAYLEAEGQPVLRGSAVRCPGLRLQTLSSPRGGRWPRGDTHGFATPNGGDGEGRHGSHWMRGRMRGGFLSTDGLASKQGGRKGGNVAQIFPKRNQCFGGEVGKIRDRIK